MAEQVKLPETLKALENFDSKKAVYTIIAVSIAALLFLIWLIYLKAPAATEVPWVKNLSALNATFNSISTMLLLLAYREVKRKNYLKHMNYMISAFISSTLFLVCYIIYHHFVGDTKFMGEGFIRPVYFFILISHIILSAFVVPLVLSAFYFAFTGKYGTHKKITRWAFPIWLYVSVTGVLIFVLLKAFG